jgi:hypothetical protein
MVSTLYDCLYFLWLSVLFMIICTSYDCLYFLWLSVLLTIICTYSCVWCMQLQDNMTIFTAECIELCWFVQCEKREMLRTVKTVKDELTEILYHGKLNSLIPYFIPFFCSTGNNHLIQHALLNSIYSNIILHFIKPFMLLAVLYSAIRYLGTVLI